MPAPNSEHTASSGGTGDNRSADMAPPATPRVADPNQTAADSGGAGDAASTDVTTAIAHDLKYTVTVGQALELFAAKGRKVPSERSIQRYCIEGIIAAQKIRTTYGSEWLINESSLNRYIAHQPVIETGHANGAETADMATPAAPTRVVAAIQVTDSNTSSDAGGATGASLTAPAGERRTLAEVLIENARILAQSEGKDFVITEKNAQIAELRDDRGFLREEVRESRKQRDQVKDIADRMLTTLESMASTRRLPEARDIAPEPIRYKPVTESPPSEGNPSAR